MLKPLCCFIFLSCSLSLTVQAEVLTSNIVKPNNKQTSEPLIQAYIAQYSLIHKDDQVGTGIRQLSYLEDGTAKYSYHSNIKWLIFSDNREETSWVKLMNNIVVPTHYVYKREGTGRDKGYEWTYDQVKNSAKDITRKREITLDFANNVQDKLSYHLQHRLNLITHKDLPYKNYTYPVISTSGSVNDYVYQFDGEEELILPYGLVKTVKYKREVLEKNRITYAWFAPELNYMMVKLYQIKADVEQFEAQLISVNLDGLPANKKS